MKPITDLSIAAIEVTQAIQCLGPSTGYPASDNSLILNADRDVAVRVYVGHDGKYPNVGPLSPVLKGAKVTVRWVAEHHGMFGAFLPEEMSTTFDVPRSTDVTELRGDADGSAIFTIPAAKLGKPYRSKSLWVEAEVTGPPGFTDADPSNDSTSVQIGGKDQTGAPIPGGMEPIEPLRIIGLPIHYHPKQAATKGWPEWKTIAKADGLIQKTYPMDVEYQMAAAFLEYGENCKCCKPIQWDSASWSNALIVALSYAMEHFDPKPDVLFGWLPKGANGNSVVWGLGTNSPPVAWLVQQSDDHRTAAGMAHETGHTQGIEHTDNDLGCSMTIVEGGFDLATKTPVPANTYDYMGSGGPAGWISPCMWSLLTGGSCACPKGGSSSSTGSFWPKKLSRLPLATMLISGTLDQEGRGLITGVQQTSSRGPFPHSVETGSYSITLTDTEGRALSTHRFDPAFRTLCDGEPAEEDGFFFQIPLPDGARRVALLREGEVLDERRAHEQRPTVTFVTPDEGEVFTSELAIAWRGEHAEDAELDYTVLYSPDGGESWNPIAIGLQDSGLHVDVRWLQGGDQCMLRIIASDGFSSTSTESPTFTVAPAESGREGAEGGTDASHEMGARAGRLDHPIPAEIRDGPTPSGADLNAGDLIPDTRALAPRAGRLDGELPEAERRAPVLRATAADEGQPQPGPAAGPPRRAGGLRPDERI